MAPYAVLILLLWTSACAYQDARCRQIDNALLYPFLLLATLWLLFNSVSLAGVAPSSALAGFFCALALTIPGHFKGILGGGDVKLMAAIGLTIGGMATLLVTAIAALLLVLWVVLAPRLPTKATLFLQRNAPGLANHQGHVAYGPFIFLALVVIQAIRL